MLFPTILSLALTGITLAAPILPRQTTTCYSGLYIIVARGSYEGVGEGSLEIIASMIEGQIPNSASVGVNYPAVLLSLTDTYVSSVEEGITDAKAKIVDYVAACGSASRIALLGFSQGGNVVTDLLAGGKNKPDPIGEEYRQYITAAAVFGDPRFNAGQPINVGTSTSNGIFARGSSQTLLNTYSNVLRSYCDEGDPACASGLLAAAHLEVVEKYAAAATEWIAALAS